MKTKIVYMLAIMFASAIIISCDKNEPKVKTAEEKQTDLLSKTWVVDAVNFDQDFETYDRTDEWPSFELTFSNGAFTTELSSFPDVWPAAGTWSFKDGDLNTIVRGDGIEMTINVTESSLTMEFPYPSDGGRVAGIDGDWRFDMLVK